MKKFKNFKIIGGAFEGKKIGEEKIAFLASLLSLDEVRSKLIRLLSAPAQKITSVLQFLNQFFQLMIIQKEQQ